MKIFNSSLELRAAIRACKLPNQTLGFVPTMGALHQGHLSLIQKAVNDNQWVVVSIFVNPTQFNSSDDLTSYPRNLEQDVLKISSVSKSKILIFAPSVSEVYGHNITRDNFDFGDLTQTMEGSFRPGHFDGVGTVVKKLFDVVAPEFAYFGEKDFQQLLVIKRLVQITNSKVKIIPCSIEREHNGLAMSSRNSRLSEQEKQQASKLFLVLKTVKQDFNKRPLSALQQWVNEQFEEDPIISLEYFQIADAKTLKPAHELDPRKEYRAFIAVYIRDIRLIDNIALN